MAFSLSAIYTECTHEVGEASEVARLRARRRASQAQGSHDALADQSSLEQPRDPRFALTSFAWGPADELKSFMHVCSHDDGLFAETSCGHCARKAHLKRVRKQRKTSTPRLGKECVSQMYMNDSDDFGRKRRKRGCAAKLKLQQGDLQFSARSESSRPEVMATSVGESNSVEEGTQFESLICVPARCRYPEKTSPTELPTPRKEECHLEELFPDPLIQDALEPQACNTETFGGEILCDEMSNESCNMDCGCIDAVEPRNYEMTPATTCCGEAVSASCTPSDVAEEILTPKVRFNAIAPLETIASARDERGEKVDLATPTRLPPKGRKRTSRKRVKPSCGFSDDDSDDDLRGGQDRRKSKMGKLAI